MDLEKIKQEYPEIPVGTRATDLTNKQYNGWKVLYRTINNNLNKTMWVCECQECGKIKPVRSVDITSGRSKNCGCVREKIKHQKRDEEVRKRDENGNIIAKRCNVCKQWLPLTDFYKNVTTKDGYHGSCKKCNSSKNNSERHLHEYKNNAQRRGINFLLTLEDFNNLVSQPCYYCNSFDDPNGIDRIDSSKDYTLDNCVPCCEKCNKMKLNYSINEWVSHMKKIIDYMENKND